MHVLLVTSYPEPKSFGGTLLEAAKTHFEARGHTVEIADLYAEGFKPVDYPKDFGHDASDPAAYFNLEDAQRQQFLKGQTPGELSAMQKRVKDADAILLFAPIYWAGPPAILKGWIERIFTAGFAFERGKIFKNGLLAGREGMFVTTCGGFLGAKDEAGARAIAAGYFAPLLDRPLSYVGITPKPTFAAVSPGQDAARRAAVLADFTKHLDAAFAQPTPPTAKPGAKGPQP